VKVLWFDITNAPHVHFLAPIIDHFCALTDTRITVRDFSETADLAKEEFRSEFTVLGQHGGRHRVKKITKLMTRLNDLKSSVSSFDFALSCGGFEACFLAKLRRRVSIAFDDNDVSPNWMYSPFTDHAFFPKAIPRSILCKQGFNAQNLFQYNGYKEDIYLANYDPDPNFLNSIPFNDYIVVRPENRMANYMRSKAQSIVPELLSALSNFGFKVLYLPRIESERYYAYGISGIFIPRKPVNGLDASYFSQAVLSGAGSLTREAALLGKPAVSFYAGKRLLAVDQQMIRDRWLFHSRKPDEIVEYVKNARSRHYDRERSKSVQNAVFKKLDRIILQ
jgi:predicted glycosyltransferase